MSLPHIEVAMDRLARFAASPFIVEGPVARAALVLAACLACMPANAAPTPDRAGYSDSVRTVQSGLDAWLGKGRAVVVDRSADPKVEAGRLSKLLGKAGRETIASPFALAAASTSTVGKVCLVVGEDPALGASEILSASGLAKVGPGDVAYRDAHVYGLWRQAALCAPTAPGQSAAMAVLAAAKATASVDLPGLAADAADLDDFASGGSGGVSGHSARKAAVAATALKADGSLAGTPYGALFRIAGKASANQPSSQHLAYAYRGVMAARDLKAIYVPASEGAVAVDWRTWLRQSPIPQARYLSGVLDHAEGLSPRGRVVPALDPSLADAASSAVASSEMGDSGAAAFLAASPVVSDIASPGPTPKLTSWDAIPGRQVPFDRSDARLVPEGDGAAFALVDASSGRETARGTAEHGIEEGGPRP